MPTNNLSYNLGLQTAIDLIEESCCNPEDKELLICGLQNSMFYNEKINSLTELEKAVLLEIVNFVFPCGQEISVDFLKNLRKDTTEEKIKISLTKVNESTNINEEVKNEFKEIIDQIKLKLDLK